MLQLTPRRSMRGVQKLLVYLSRGSHQIQRLLIIDPQENRNRYDFLNVRRNAPVRSSDFLFNPPAGTRIIKS
jgi:outer membrane lipoprotein-sorting protein